MAYDPCWECLAIEEKRLENTKECWFVQLLVEKGESQQQRWMINQQWIKSMATFLLISRLVSWEKKKNFSLL